MTQSLDVHRRSAELILIIVAVDLVLSPNIIFMVNNIEVFFCTISQVYF
uniref:Uncharacterized protein n=1 Tax=Rhizophora mucronata TaxID=61149 RepID=A0A2P2NKP8_RHIMU